MIFTNRIPVIIWLLLPPSQVLFVSPFSVSSRHRTKRAAQDSFLSLSRRSVNDLYDDYEEDNEDDYLFSSDSPSRMYRDYWDESEELNGEKRTDRFDKESEPQQFTAEEDLMEDLFLWRIWDCIRTASSPLRRKAHRYRSFCRQHFLWIKP